MQIINQMVSAFNRYEDWKLYFVSKYSQASNGQGLRPRSIMNALNKEFPALLKGDFESLTQVYRAICDICEAMGWSAKSPLIHAPQAMYSWLKSRKLYELTNGIQEKLFDEQYQTARLLAFPYVDCFAIRLEQPICSDKWSHDLLLVQFLAQSDFDVPIISVICIDKDFTYQKLGKYKKSLLMEKFSKQKYKELLKEFEQGQLKHLTENVGMEMLLIQSDISDAKLQKAAPYARDIFRVIVGLGAYLQSLSGEPEFRKAGYPDDERKVMVALPQENKPPTTVEELFSVSSTVRLSRKIENEGRSSRVSVVGKEMGYHTRAPHMRRPKGTPPDHPKTIPVGKKGGESDERIEVRVDLKGKLPKGQKVVVE